MTDTLRDEIVTLTTDLMRFRSTADQPEQIAAAMDYIAHYLEPIPGLFVHRSERNGKPSIVATLCDTRHPALMLNGHIDVVPALPEQFAPQVCDGRIYGRASQDMKGSVAVLLRLLKDLAALELRPNVGFQFVSDEEIGGEHGTARLVKEGWHCDFFLAAEPTDMSICYEQKGGIWIKLHIPGTAAHASRPWEGINPNFALASGLTALEARFPPPDQEVWQTTVMPTAVHSPGDTHNQVPAHITLTIDIRRTADDPPEMLLNAVKECFPTATVLNHKTVSPLATNPQHPAVQTLAAVTEHLRGQPTRIYREHFSSDARFYSAVNIPAVCFGPVGAGLHSEEEWVEIDSLVQFYDILRAYVKRSA